MYKHEPRGKETELTIIYKYTLPAVKCFNNGKYQSNSRIAIELRVIDGKLKDVLINGAPFILNLNPAKKASGVKDGKA